MIDGEQQAVPGGEKTGGSQGSREDINAGLLPEQYILLKKKYLVLTYKVMKTSRLSCN